MTGQAKNSSLPLGDHGGLTPLADRDRVRGVLLRTLGRLKAGAGVPERRKAIERCLALVAEDDPHWMEAIASRLSSEGKIEAVPAHLAALAAGWEIADGEVARLVRAVNTQGSQEFSQRAVAGMVAAAPEMEERVLAGRIDSDQVFIRAALAHLFRRDPSSTFVMFIIDGVVRNLPKALKLSVNAFVSSCLERFDEEPAPEGTWGYVLVLRDVSGKAGYFIQEPTETNMAELRRVRGQLEGLMGPLSDAAFYNHVAAAAFSGHLKMGSVGGFAGLMSGLMKEMNDRFIVLYAREEEGPGGGVHTDIFSIPAKTPEEARRIALKLPEVRMNDDFRGFAEFMAQHAELADQEKS